MVEIVPNWHPVFVHFTVALLTVSVVLKLAAYVVSGDSLRQQLRLVARWNLWIGAGFVVLTVLTGVLAYNTVAHDTPSHTAMTDHRNWALVTAALFLVLAIWMGALARGGKSGGGLFIVSLLVAASLLAITAWKGGELVYRYGLGVMSLPKADTHGHADGEQHDHGTVMEGTHDNSDGHHDVKTADDHHDNSDGHHDENKTDHRHDNSDGHHDSPSTSPGTSTNSQSSTSKDDHFADGHTH